MKKNKLMLTLFCCLCVAQIAVPISMIIHREDILRTGALYRFRTEPVDPSDAFRGRYVALDVQASRMLIKDKDEFERGEKLYAELTRDENGMAKIKKLTRKPPDSEDYLKVRVMYWFTRPIDGDKNRRVGMLRLDMPIKRYYMDEYEAPRAERAYNSRSRSGEVNSFVDVRVKRGEAVVEELYIGEKPVYEYLKDMR